MRAVQHTARKHRPDSSAFECRTDADVYPTHARCYASSSTAPTKMRDFGYSLVRIVAGTHVRQYRPVTAAVTSGRSRSSKLWSLSSLSRPSIRRPLDVLDEAHQRLPFDPNILLCCLLRGPALNRTRHPIAATFCSRRRRGGPIARRARSIGWSATEARVSPTLLCPPFRAIPTFADDLRADSMWSASATGLPLARSCQSACPCA